jgi:dienelactone hydrolase
MIHLRACVLSAAAGVTLWMAGSVLAAGVAGTPEPNAAARNAPAAETTSQTVEDGGTGSYKAILVGDSTLSTHTIFRPKDLSLFGEKAKLPIVAWGNGGCANSPRGAENFLSEIASHGFLVIAIGPVQPAGQAGQRGGGMGGGTKSSQLLDAVEWAIAQNSNKASQYYNKIDTTKIGVLGHSCGGLQAIEVSADPRITTTIVGDSGILNAGGGAPGAGPGAAPGAAPDAAAGGRRGGPGGGGMPGMPPLTKEFLAKLHAPVLYLLGGSSDIAYPNGTDDFKRLDKLPAVMASLDVGHGGTYSRPHGGEFAKVAVSWFKWHLKGDKEAAKMFAGSPCELAKTTGWTVEKKNIP